MDLSFTPRELSHDYGYIIRCLGNLFDIIELTQ